MRADQPSPIRFEATLRHPDRERARQHLTKADVGGLDLLPPGIRASDEGITAHAFLDADDCAELLRAGFRVELTAVTEGPVDPDRIMSDEQARAELVRRLGAERAARVEGA